MKNSNTDYPLREKLRPVEETLNRLFRAAKADDGTEKRLLYCAYLQAATDLGYIVVQADDERIFLFDTLSVYSGGGDAVVHEALPAE